jgi:ferredoxin-NADP reductase
LIGAGAGVAPLVALLEGEQYAPGDAILITRDSSPQEALRTDAIDRLVQHRGLTRISLDGPRAEAGSTWLSASHAAWKGADLLRYVVGGDLSDVDVYICGPGPWMTSLSADLRAAGVAASHVHSEAFSI